MSHVIVTPRLRLRNWRGDDRDAFATLNADAEVMWDLGGPLTRKESDDKFDRYSTTFGQAGFCRWALEDQGGRFLGYAGLMPARADHPLGPHVDIGWRLLRAMWGKGYATEAARACLQDGFMRMGLQQILAATAADNARSQAVIRRLGMKRAESLDYAEPLGSWMWHGLVWIARKDGADVSMNG